MSGFKSIEKHADLIIWCDGYEYQVTNGDKMVYEGFDWAEARRIFDELRGAA